VEIEAKFRLIKPSEEDLGRLITICTQAGYAVEVNPDPIDIVDIYFDRVDHALRQAGVALRIRNENSETLLTFKRKVSQEGALHSRIELEAPPTLDHLRRVYAELERLDLPLAKGQPQYVPGIELENVLKAWDLVPMLEISTKRYRLEVGRDRILASIVLDRVQFQHGTLQRGYMGIEIEAADGEDAETVMALSEILRSEWGEGIKEQAVSKYEFALESLGINR
jgi:inorganic triphosphatase YgiF